MNQEHDAQGSAQSFDPEQMKQTGKIIGFALFASQVLYIALLLSGIVVVSEAPQFPYVPIALGGAGFGAAVISHFMWRKAARLQDEPETSTSQQMLLGWCLVSWAMDESIALHGLVLGILGYPALIWSPFTIVALILAILHRPWWM